MVHETWRCERPKRIKRPGRHKTLNRSRRLIKPKELKGQLDVEPLISIFLKNSLKCRLYIFKKKMIWSKYKSCEIKSFSVKVHIMSIVSLPI